MYFVQGISDVYLQYGHKQLAQSICAARLMTFFPGLISFFCGQIYATISPIVHLVNIANESGVESLANVTVCWCFSYPYFVSYDS
jgi:hypothetical protein